MEEYTAQLISAALQDMGRIVTKTLDGGMFMPCMVGQLEGQFLKLFIENIGTFKG